MDDGIYKARYIGKPIMGYRPARTYEISIERDGYVYDIEAIGDEDAGLIQYASETSIRQNWEITGKGL